LSFSEGHTANADKTDMELLHKDITDKILKAFYTVYNELGLGFWKKYMKMQ
jgi:hypothetical protein